MPYTYRSAFVYEFVDTKVLMGGGLNPLSGATEALNKWSAEGFEPFNIQHDQSDSHHVTTYITFRKAL